MPKVSVIIPSYNHEKFVGRAIQSVLGQTYQNFEIVVTDDGSSDGTVDEILRFADPRIRFLRFETNRGACVAANKCIEESSGEYIAMLSSDDIFMPEKLEKQVLFLDGHRDTGAVFGYAELIDEEDRNFIDTSHRYYSVFHQPNRSRVEWLNQFFYRGNCLCHPTAMIRRKCYDTVGLYDPRYAQLPDFDFWIRLCLKYEIHVMPENLIMFRILSNEANTSGMGYEKTARLIRESAQVLRHYLGISRSDFMRIFPDVSALMTEVNEDLIPFYIAREALKIQSQSQHYKEFALDVLFDILKDSAMAEKISEASQFAYADYLKISGDIETFSTGEMEEKIALKEIALREAESKIIEKDRQIACQGEQIAGLEQGPGSAEKAFMDQEIARLRSIEESMAWTGMKKILDAVDHKILPLHTRRSKVIRPLISSAVRLFTGLGGDASSLDDGRADSGNIEIFRRKQGREVPGIRKISFLITPFDHQSKRYRVYNLIEELTMAGIDCCTFHESDFSASEEVLDCSVLIIFRVAMNERVNSIISAAHERKIPVVFDIDDLIFDSECLGHFDGLKYMSEYERRKFIEGVSMWKETLLACDYCTCTTEALKKQIVKAGKKAFVIPNSINNGQYSFAKQLVKNRPERKPQRTRIGYFSGTNTHNRDFLEASDALYRILKAYPSTEFHLVGELNLDKKFGEFGDRVVLNPLMPHLKYLEYNSQMDITLAPLEPDNIFTAAKSELKIFESALVEVPTVASPAESYANCIKDGVNGFLARTPDEWYEKMALLIENPPLRKKMGAKARKQIAERHYIKKMIPDVLTLYRYLVKDYCAVSSLRSRQYVLPEKPPLISVVSVLYNKEKQVGCFIESLARQSYPGAYEIIFVDDCSSDKSVSTVMNIVAESSRALRNIPDIRVIRNETNAGNCASRNAGIRSAAGDIIVVIDADCIVNRDFLIAHAEAYAYDDCEMAIGPFNLETNGKDPLDTLAYYEENHDQVSRDMLLQDMMNERSFVNCITRNFSIRKSAVRGELFDEKFSYSKDKESGFGWEDVEMGYRLYLQGARVKFLPDAFSIHISHPSSVDEGSKPLRSLKNFRRLHEKYPDLYLAARRWSLDTYQKICEWSDHHKHPVNDDRQYLDSRFERFLPPPFYIKSGRKLRILTYRWHCSHQYELYKLPYEFTLAKGCGTAISEFWDYDKRPLRGNARMKHIEEINPRDYDVAILHFDENVLAPENTNNVITPEWRWGDSFKWFRKNLRIPMVAVCHGTPQFHGQYNIHYNKSDLMAVIERERKRLVDYLGEVPVVVNSYQAQREWGFRNSKVIWHGFDPAEFCPSRYEKGIFDDA